MGCFCPTSDDVISVAFGTGQESCEARVLVRSWCRDIIPPFEEAIGFIPDPSPPAEIERPAADQPPRPRLCRAFYDVWVTNAPPSKAKIVSFQVEGRLAISMAPSISLFARFERVQPASCEKRAVGKVTIECDGQRLEVGPFKVCVLSGPE